MAMRTEQEIRRNLESMEDHLNSIEHCSSPQLLMEMEYSRHVYLKELLEVQLHNFNRGENDE